MWTTEEPVVSGPVDGRDNTDHRDIADPRPSVSVRVGSCYCLSNQSQRGGSLVWSPLTPRIDAFVIPMAAPTSSPRSNGPARLLRSYYLVALVLGILLLLLARLVGTSGPPGARGSVLGTITDLDDVPLANIQVTLSGVADATTVSGADGSFAIDELTPGTYQIEAHGRGFPKRVYDEPLLVRPGRSTTVHMQLRHAVREFMSPIVPEATGETSRDQPDLSGARPPDGANRP